MPPLAMIFGMAALSLGAAFWAAESPATVPTKQIRLVLVGDSTVTDTAGWGLGFRKLLTADVECINLAKGGRSSRSFRAEGHWDTVADLKPDYVLIQFGHNDQPGKGPERETDAATEFPENLARYVREARDAGATPILVTSLTRRRFGNDGKIHSDLDPYVAGCRAAAEQTGAPLIDLHSRSIEFCNALGRDRCEQELSPRKDDGSYDSTHLTAHGSDLIAPLVAAELVRVVPDLGPHIHRKAPATEGTRNQ